MESRSTGRKGKPKVKSGCRTCKQRKLKCDEGRPACQRCLSAGRHCEGYGIWGGGSNAAAKDLDNQFEPKEVKVLLARAPRSALAVCLDPEEQQYFEWFRSHSAIKLPGTFRNAFWQSLLLSASHSGEPAVLNAILALSSVQNRGAIVHRNETIDYAQPQDNFALRHYVKAISYVRPHLTDKNKELRRSALIACVCFVCMEFLRGCFQVAEIHLLNGLQVMEQVGMLIKGDDGVLRSARFTNTVDEWVVDAFSRLHFQTRLFKYHGSSAITSLQITHHEAYTESVNRITKSWHIIQSIFNDIFALKGRIQEACESGDSYSQDDSPFREKQHQIRMRLSKWFEETRKVKPVRDTFGYRIGYDLLDTYQIMAIIMLDICMPSRCEMDYDTHNTKFLTMMMTMVNMWDYTQISSHYRPRPGLRVQNSRSIADLGVIQPLTFVALKCRVHRLRSQAIRMLESVSHREGYMDSQSSAVVAAKVMQIEEADFYQGYEMGEGFALLDPPRSKDLLPGLPKLPESHRMDIIDITFVGSPMDRIELSCSQERLGLEYRNYYCTYEISSQAWSKTEITCLDAECTSSPLDELNDTWMPADMHQWAIQASPGSWSTDTWTVSDGHRIPADGEMIRDSAINVSLWPTQDDDLFA